MGARPGGDGAAGGEGEDGAVEGVFETDERGGAGVDVAGGDGVGDDVGEGEVVVVGGGDGDGEGAADGGEEAGFPVGGRVGLAYGKVGGGNWEEGRGRRTSRLCDFLRRRLCCEVVHPDAFVYSVGSPLFR